MAADTPTIVALMPMKVHSERVPNKNFRLLCGRPLYEYTLRALLACARVSRIVVDTDCDTLRAALDAAFSPPEAARIEVLSRPAHLRGDMVPMNEILAYDVTVVSADLYLQTHTTNPFLSAATVEAAVDALLAARPSRDSLFTVTPLRQRLYDVLGRPVNHNPAVLLRTQDLPPLLAENSCLYVFTADALAARRQRIGDRPLLFEMGAAEALDIDDETDWAVAEALMPAAIARGAVIMSAAPAPVAPVEAALAHAAIAPSADVAGALVHAAAPAEEAAVRAPASRALVMPLPVRPVATAAPPAPSVRLTVLVSAPYMLPHLGRFAPLLERFGIDVLTPPNLRERLTEAQLLQLAGCFDATICGDDAYTPAALAACAPRLKVISKWGTGIDSIDARAAASHGIAVRNTPGAFTHPVADSSLAYMLSFARGAVANDAAVKAGTWAKAPGVCLAECTVGLIGLGAVGRAIAERALAFGAAVVATDPAPPPAEWRAAHPGVRVAPLPDVLRAAHFLVLACDLNPSSRHIVDADALAALRPGAYLINCARGPLVDEAALVDALRSGRLAGAALDVFEHEPLPADSPLRSLPTLLAPHNANASPACHERVHWSTLTHLLDELGVPYEAAAEGECE